MLSVFLCKDKCKKIKYRNVVYLLSIVSTAFFISWLTVYKTCNNSFSFNRWNNERNIPIYVLIYLKSIK